jgi:hypothetical protein
MYSEVAGDNTLLHDFDGEINQDGLQQLVSDVGSYGTLMAKCLTGAYPPPVRQRRDYDDLFALANDGKEQMGGWVGAELNGMEQMNEQQPYRPEKMHPIDRFEDLMSFHKNVRGGRQGPGIDSILQHDEPNKFPEGYEQRLHDAANNAVKLCRALVGPEHGETRGHNEYTCSVPAEGHWLATQPAYDSLLTTWSPDNANTPAEDFVSLAEHAGRSLLPGATVACKPQPGCKNSDSMCMCQQMRPRDMLFTGVLNIDIEGDVFVKSGGEAEESLIEPSSAERDPEDGKTWHFNIRDEENRKRRDTPSEEHTHPTYPWHMGPEQCPQENQRHLFCAAPSNDYWVNLNPEPEPEQWHGEDAESGTIHMTSVDRFGQALPCTMQKGCLVSARTCVDGEKLNGPALGLEHIPARPAFGVDQRGAYSQPAETECDAEKAKETPYQLGEKSYATGLRAAQRFSPQHERSDQLLCHRIAPGYSERGNGVIYENTCNQGTVLGDGVVGHTANGNACVNAVQSPCTQGDFLTWLHSVTDPDCELTCAEGYHAVYIRGYRYYPYYRPSKYCDDGYHGKKYHDSKCEYETVVRTLTCGIDGGEITSMDEDDHGMGELICMKTGEAYPEVPIAKQKSYAHAKNWHATSKKSGKHNTNAAVKNTKSKLSGGPNHASTSAGSPLVNGLAGFFAGIVGCLVALAISKRVNHVVERPSDDESTEATRLLTNVGFGSAPPLA